MKQNKFISLVGLGLFVISAAACGDESDEPELVRLTIGRSTPEVVIENRSNDEIELSLGAVVVCPDVRRNERVEVDAFRLEPQGRMLVQLDSQTLELTKFGNEGGCQITPVASARLGLDEFTLMGNTLILDTEGRPINDPELDPPTECTDARRCIERD